MAKQAFRNAGWCTLLFAASRVMAGQDVINGPAPTPPLTTPAMQEDIDDSQMSVFIPFGSGNGNLPDPFKYDNIVVRPHVSYEIQYGNGIQSAPGHPQSSFIHQLSPGVRVDLGKYWSADYTPTLTYYSNSKFKSEFDYVASLAGNTRIGDWSFGVSQTVNVSSAPLAETGTQTDEEDYTTSLTAGYIFNDKISLDMIVSQDLNYIANPVGTSANASAVDGTSTWSTTEWLNYEIWPRLTVGVGPGGGYVSADAVPNQTYESLNGRIKWRATNKISFVVSGGFQDTQFAAQGESDMLSPIFNASIHYQPFQLTQITLTASRQVTSSTYYILSNAAENTLVSLDLNQRLLKKFNLDLMFSYNSTAYTESLSLASLGINKSLADNHTDNSYVFNARLSRQFMKRGTWSLTYQYTDFQSATPGLAYNSSLFGIELGYTY